MDLSYAVGWRPNEGDTIIGTVVDVGLGSNKYGGRYPIITIDPDDGGDAVAVHGFHAALKARLSELRPRVGERIGVKFVGKREHKSDSGKEVADYIVKIEGRGAENVWAQVDTDATTAPRSDVPADTSDFEPRGGTKPADDDDIPF